MPEAFQSRKIDSALNPIKMHIVRHFIYGFEDESEHQIKFSLAKNRETLVVKVEDDGIPFNPLDVAGPKLSHDLESINIGGLGIHLVKEMMDDIDYQRVEGKNKLILKKCVAAA